VANLFYRNPRLTILAVMLATIAGLAALGSLARSEDPTMASRFGTITTFFPGASALRVESLVTEPIEGELRELHEIVEIDSTSRTGVSMIAIQFGDDYGFDEVDEVWSKVRDRVSKAAGGLPAGSSVPVVEDRTPTALTLLPAFVWDGDGDAPLGILTRFGEELQNRLRNVPGTKEVELLGEAEEEVRVTIDPFEVASLGLRPSDISTAIARADSKVPAGQLRAESSQLVIEVAGELTSVERIRRIPLRQEADGRVLRVGDVAQVEKTVREPVESVALIRGRRGVMVAATMEPSNRVDIWAEKARAIVDAYRAEMPPGISLELVFDQSLYTEARLANLAGNLLLASGIVWLVLLVMMGARSALIVGSALPLTVAMVLTQYNWIGMPLHQMSITGLIIALGLLIDNAIVVVDEYNSLVQEGRSPGDAVSEAVRHLFVPLLASSVTTILAFLPIVLSPGPMSEFVGPISIGVALAVGSSFLLSMTVIPSIAGHFTAERGEPGSRFWRDGYSNARILAWYERSLDFVLARPWRGVAISLALPLLGFYVVTTLPSQFFPSNDRNQFQVQIVLPSQTSLAVTVAAVKRARSIVNGKEEVVESHWIAGEGTPRVYYNVMPGQERNSAFAGGFVNTTSAAATSRLLRDLQRELSDAFPEARILASAFEQGPPFDAPIELRVVGPDIGELRRLGEELRVVLAQSDNVTYTLAQLRSGEPKLLFEADEEALRMAGLRLVDVADQLSGRIEGVVGGSVLEANQELPVRVRVADADRSELSRLASDYVVRDGAMPTRGVIGGVPLSAVSKVTLVPELAGVPRRDGERVNTVQAFLLPFTIISASLEDFQHRLDQSGFELPTGYRLEIGGESEQSDDAMANLMRFAVPLFVLMAGTIILSFNSFRMAGIIGIVAFLSIGLAFVGVWAFGHPMGFNAILGTMGLVGLAINGAIVVLSALRASPGCEHADPEEVRDVVVSATRHIVSTTLTTVGGFIPLIVFGGRFWGPLATGIAGGVGGSAILALYLVPSLYVSFVRRQDQRDERHDPTAVGANVERLETPPPRKSEIGLAV
jgi:multidrug efflux pump subunit AcrB